MFNQINQANAIEIGIFSQSVDSDKGLNPQHLRDIWADHLLNEQLKLDKEYARKHPLSIEFQSRKFFAN